ncbi:MAG: hypothetical protein ABSB42_10345 [Tepidisphaeraceae bacterium]|jgi:uncharacterized protein DUF6978
MADLDLTQAEADELLRMENVRTDDKEYLYPTMGLLTVPLASKDRSESFLRDIRRVRIDISKVTYQNRARQVVVLARLDLNGPRHRNPDDAEIPCPHLHVYREGFGDRWAYPLSPGEFTNPADPWQTLQDFMRYCNVTEPPIISRGIFT